MNNENIIEYLKQKKYDSRITEFKLLAVNSVEKKKDTAIFHNVKIQWKDKVIDNIDIEIGNFDATYPLINLGSKDFRFRFI
jgi:hypothetical protein